MCNTKLTKYSQGLRYYTYDENEELKTVRIAKYIKPGKFIIYDEKSGKEYYFTSHSKLDKFLSEYRLLEPDMWYTFDTPTKTDVDSYIQITVYQYISDVFHVDAIVTLKDGFVYGSVDNPLLQIESEEFFDNLYAGYITDTAPEVIKMLKYNAHKKKKFFSYNTWEKKWNENIDKYFSIIHDSRRTLTSFNDISYMVIMAFWRFFKDDPLIKMIPFRITDRERDIDMVDAYCNNYLCSTDYDMVNLKLYRYDKDIDLSNIHMDCLILKDEVVGETNLLLYTKIRRRVDTRDFSNELSDAEQNILLGKF